MCGDIAGELERWLVRIGLVVENGGFGRWENFSGTSIDIVGYGGGCCE